MGDEKGGKSPNGSDSKKTGNSCGFTLGCLVIIVAVAAVIFFLFIKPALEEAGYSYDDLEDKVLDIRDKADKALSEGKELYQGSKEKFKGVQNQADETIEKGREIYEDSSKKVKGKIDEKVEDLQDFKDKTDEDLSRNAPQLIAD